MASGHTGNVTAPPEILEENCDSEGAQHVAQQWMMNWPGSSTLGRRCQLT